MANVTPGFTFTSTTPITATALNLVAQPSVTLGTNEVALTNLPAAASNNLWLARRTAGAGNYEAVNTAYYGIGYYPGAGSTVTQATSKATGFTLSKLTGKITLAGDVLNAGTIVSATWTNTLIAATDVVIINHLSGGTIGAYTFNVACDSGTATLYIRNNTAGNLTETPVLSFVVIKGAIT